MILEDDEYAPEDESSYLWRTKERIPSSAEYIRYIYFKVTLSFPNNNNKQRKNGSLICWLLRQRRTGTHNLEWKDVNMYPLLSFLIVLRISLQSFFWYYSLLKKEKELW